MRKKGIFFIINERRSKGKLLLISSFFLAFAGLHNSAQAQIEEKVRINGYSSFEYEYRLSDEGNSDPNGSFDADLFDIVLNVDISSRLRFATDITWEHGTATEEGIGNAAVEYAFPEYTIRNWLKVRVGKMFLPFGIYNEIHTAKPAFLAVKEPLSTNKPDKFGADERFYPRWATGISVLGNFSVNTINFEYNVQVSNGYQENTNPFEEDDNTQKAIAARLLMQPIPGLKVGFSTYSDRITELDDTTGEDTGERTKLSSFSTHAEYSVGDFGLEFEYITGKTDPSDPTDLKKDAFEGMLYYTLKDRFTPYFRYEYLDPDKDVEDDTANMLSFGLNTLVDKNYFLKLQYNRISSGEANARFNAVDFSEFQAAVVLGF
ncbi:outer membrane beta-barrel protein [Ekhidna sp.]